MTTRCFVIGHPVAHSRSPLIHGAWLALHGFAGSYERIDVAPSELGDFVVSIRQGSYRGGNVTVPHKEAVLPYCDALSPVARTLGAVNTLLWHDGALSGDNTDVAGFLAHLDASAPGWDARVRTALVLGAGGAARAVVAGLSARGVGAITIVNRNEARAEVLSAAFGGVIAVAPWESRSALVGAADLVVNTTMLGMRGQPALALDLTDLNPGAIVYDLVYVPLRTPLLAEAERCGALAVDGLGMLLHQAVPGFERWFGVRPEVTPALRALLEADIRAAGP